MSRLFTLVAVMAIFELSFGANSAFGENSTNQVPSNTESIGETDNDGLRAAMPDPGISVDDADLEPAHITKARTHKKHKTHAAPAEESPSEEASAPEAKSSAYKSEEAKTEEESLTETSSKSAGGLSLPDAESEESAPEPKVKRQRRNFLTLKTKKKLTKTAPKLTKSRKQTLTWHTMIRPWIRVRIR